MRTVWKYDLDISGPLNELAMPKNGIIRFLDMQYGLPKLWVEVYTEDEKAFRLFEWVGTGHAVPINGKYIGTAVVYNGNLVLHLYEILPIAR